MDIELNDDWINNFEKSDRLYEDFYKDDLYFINLKFIYINRNNEIDIIKEESFLMSKPNIISREEILEILKITSFVNDRRYTLLSILKYNILLDTDDVKDFIISNEERNYLTKVKNIDTIIFEKTISMFQDLNELNFIFFEKSCEFKKKDPNNSTKRIYLNSINGNKKTIKKQYKD